MIILDVREKDEIEAERIPGSVFCPLSQFDLMAPGIVQNLKNEEVVIMCRSGNRAKLALDALKKLPADHLSFSVYEGGIQRWKKDGKKVEGGAFGIPVMRQVLIFASSLIFLSFAGWAFVDPRFIYLSLAIAGGLAMAGWTGFCPAALILQKMPWNQRKSVGASCCSKEA